jgi:phosphatidylserine/phosphatidylglycerophosphate/cardiolipin synthase-like enzyme
LFYNLHVESLWNKATPSDQRFREIEEGLDAEVFEVFNNGEKVGQIVLDLARSAEKEMLIHLPNDKSMVRLERLGVIDEIIQASRKGVVVKILSPLSKENTHIVKKIYDNSTTTEILNGNKSPYQYCKPRTTNSYPGYSIIF